MSKANPVCAGRPFWGNLVHLSTNMWADCRAPEWQTKNECVSYCPELRFETEVWNEILKRMARAGMDMLVLDLGDGVRYESHPEIAVRRAWTTKRLRRELRKIRDLGMEPIPKLNFSTAHDAWMGPYSRCVSTDAYYAVCRDLIAEIADLFDEPRLFHLGMDEETARHQRRYEYVVLRQHDLWWRDLGFLVDQVERAGARAWVWSDYVWEHPDVFFKRMPKSVLQSNWYYGASFSKKRRYVAAYLDLEAHGYDQAPTGSNYGNPMNFGKTVAYSRRNIEAERLHGFLQTPWVSTRRRDLDHHIEAIDLVAKEIARWARNG